MYIFYLSEFNSVLKKFLGRKNWGGGSIAPLTSPKLHQCVEISLVFLQASHSAKLSNTAESLVQSNTNAVKTPSQQMVTEYFQYRTGFHLTQRFPSSFVSALNVT